MQSKGFSMTRWSLVIAAADSRHPDHEAALEELCSAYWYPVYAFVRLRGFDPESARDLTQGFFAQLLEKRTLKAADKERGRFRSFVLAALKFHLSHEKERTLALKRGGGMTPIPIDGDTAEGKYRVEPVDRHTPETLFERRWAMLLLERALTNLREELKESARPERSLRLAEYLTGDSAAPGYKQVAQELGMSESAVKVAVHRLRGRFRELLRDEVAQTVSDPGMVDDELSHLFVALEEK
jgi:DNA-directed RNA polymerase specialized sigma24 family protein